MSATLLKDHQFHEYCKVLKIPQNQLVPSDPDKKLIEKAFRKCALKTHPDKVHNSTVYIQTPRDFICSFHAQII